MKRSAWLLPLLLATVSCSMVPDYRRPDVPVPAAWRGSGSEAIAPAWPERGWWRAFNSPTLDDLIATAEANNTDIAAAAARVQQAEAQLRAAGASLLPAVDSSFDAARRRRGAGGGSFGDYGLGLAASYEADFWGRNAAGVASAAAAGRASRFDGATVALTVVGDVATTYFQALLLHDRLRIARRNLANAERVLSIVEAKVRNGAVSPLDLAQQRAAVANQRAAVPPLESQLRQTENALAILTGSLPQAMDLPPGSLGRLSLPEVVAGLPSQLLERRPDILSAEARLVAANADIGAARAAFFPRIALTGQTGLQSAALSTLLDPAGSLMSLAAGLAQPIFDGGRLAAGVDLARARRDELVQDYRATVLNAFADVEDALVVVDQATQEEALRAEAAEQARQALDLAEARYREGAVDLLAVLDAQRTLFQAEDQLAQLRFARLEALVFLFRALGGGWQPDHAAA